MALYTYHATDMSGKPVRGSMEARDEGALVARLQEMGYFPISVGRVEDRGVGLAGGAGSYLRGLLFGRIPDRDLINFTEQLYGLVEAGLPIDRALAVLADIEENQALEGIIRKLHGGLRDGGSLADSMAKHPGTFSDTYVSLVRAGEASGTLEAVLMRLRSYLEERRRIREEIVSALIYPAILVAVGGGSVALMLLFVVPRFALIFADMGGALPLPTRALLWLSRWLRGYWWVVPAFAAAAGLVLSYGLRTDSGRLWLDRLRLRVPVTGMLYSKVVAARFFRTLGILLQSGLPLIEALRIARDTMGNRAMAGEVDSVIEGVRRGRGLALPLKESGRFPPLSAHMLSVGEEAGNLDEMLVRLAGIYERDVGTAVKRLLALMEPAIILAMAVLVGFIVVSLLLAVFSLNDIPM